MRTFLIGLLLFFTHLYAAVNYITLCSMGGQLGNQLFSVAMTLGYGWEYGLVPVFSENEFQNFPGGKKNWENIFFRLPQTMPKKVSKHPLTHVNYADLTCFPPIRGNLCFCGLRTEFWYFDRYKTRIRELFQPSQEIKQKLLQSYPDILVHSKTVAVHIRTYHPIKFPCHLFLGKEYYVKAIESFPKDHLFVIFSDRIDWCRDNLQQLDRQLIFIDSKDHLLDFYLMASCKNIITSNSTYSWWAAYLKEDNNGLVLVPDRWFLRCVNVPLNDVIVRKFYPHEWIVLSVENDSLCYDLLEYETTSLDEIDTLALCD